MSRFSFALARGAPPRILAAVMVLAGAGGTAVVISAATASAKSTLPPLDHQLCYSARPAAPFKIPSGVRLANQFSPKGFRVAIKQADVLCNPTVKILPPPNGTTIPVKNPRAHLVCFPITALKQPSREVIVSNQFGKAMLITGQPVALCLPSWKSLTAPPTVRAVQPPGLDHFTCYPVKLAPNSKPFHPPPVMLKDEFTSRPVPVQVQPIPSALCVPTKKTIGTHVTRIVNSVGHLLCFPTTKTPVKPKVFVKNQFGRRAMAVAATLGLCVPSHKTIVHP
jgi:hypothetical protein